MFGIDIGVLVMAALASVTVVAAFVAIYQWVWGLNKYAEDGAFFIFAIGFVMLFVSGLLLITFARNEVEIISEDGWEVAETHELVSLASIDGSGRRIEGYAWAYSSSADAGVYLLVERCEDGGLRKLAVDAEEAVIYETDEPSCRAELVRPITTITQTLVSPSWWFPSSVDKFADGPVVTVEDAPSWRAKEEWRLYLPKGSIVAGEWDAGIGLDGE